MKRVGFAATAALALVMGCTTPVQKVPSPSCRVSRLPFKLGIAGYSFHQVRDIDRIGAMMQSYDCHYLCHKDFFLPYDADEKAIADYEAKLAKYGVKTATPGPLYFSEENGIVETETKTPIVIDVLAHKQVMGAANGTPNKKAPLPSQLYYNLPGSCDINITLNDQLLAEKSLPIAQFGVAVPLAMNLFTKGDLPKILFNPHTGNIESISK